MKQLNYKTNIVFIFTLIFIITVIISAQIVLSEVKNEAQNNIRKSLYTVIQTTNEALNIWIKYEKHNIKDFTENKNILLLTQQLISEYQNKEDLINSPVQKKLYNIIKQKIDKHDYKGFFIIAPNKISVASMRNSNIGTTNIIHKQRPTYLERVFNGETLFIPTITSDVPLRNSNKLLKTNIPTMFIASPIYNDNKVIAVLTFRLDPAHDFTRITQLGQIGDSGETYAFDKNGLLLTESRFDYQLKKIALISPGEKGMLTIRITDPGVDLTKGQISKIKKEKQPLTFMVQSALTGKTNYNIEGYRDYRGVNVVGTWLWDNNLGIGLATEIDKDEAMKLYYHTRLSIIIVLSITILLTFILLRVIVNINKRSKKILKEANENLEEKINNRTIELKESEEKFRTMFESSADAMILFTEKKFIDCNDATLNMFKCNFKEEFLSKEIGDWSADNFKVYKKSKQERISEKLELALNRGKYSFEWVYLRSDGEAFQAEVLLTCLYMNQEKIIQGTIRDISQRKKHEQKLISLNKELEELTFLDGLTGISNRRMFNNTLESEWLHCRRDKKALSLIIIDIDFFKQYNDYYGHEEGDKCLIKVAQTLQSITKRSTDLTARYGGEEFVILLPNTTNKNAYEIAKKCLVKIKNLKIYNKNSSISEFLTISCGISTIVPSYNLSSSSLIKSADKLLYKAKRTGRNKLICEFNNS